MVPVVTLCYNIMFYVLCFIHFIESGNNCYKVPKVLTFVCALVDMRIYALSSEESVSNKLLRLLLFVLHWWLLVVH